MTFSCRTSDRAPWLQRRCHLAASKEPAQLSKPQLSKPQLSKPQLFKKPLFKGLLYSSSLNLSANCCKAKRSSKEIIKKAAVAIPISLKALPRQPKLHRPLIKMNDHCHDDPCQP